MLMNNDCVTCLNRVTSMLTVVGRGLGFRVFKVGVRQPLAKGYGVRLPAACLYSNLCMQPTSKGTRPLDPWPE